MSSVDSLKTCWDWRNLARKCLLKIRPMKADKRAIPGPGGDIFPSREGWFLRCSEVWERLQPESLIMKILIYPEGAICWFSPKNFSARVGIGPAEQMCGARLLGFLNSCSSGRSFPCLYLPTSGQLASCLNTKRKLHPFSLGNCILWSWGSPVVSGDWRQGRTAWQANESWGGTVTVKHQSSLGIHITYSSYQPTLVKGEDLETEALKGPWALERKGLTVGEVAGRGIGWVRLPLWQ